MVHSFGLWIYYNAQTIQAVCAVLALGGLIGYAVDTHRIRDATLAQSDASRRPYFQAEDWPNPGDAEAFNGKDYYQFKNCGSGIALNVRWRFQDNPEAALVPLGSCAVGRVKYPFTSDGKWVDYEEIATHKGVYLEYDDTAEKTYWSTVLIKKMQDGSFHAFVDTGLVEKKAAPKGAATS